MILDLPLYELRDFYSVTTDFSGYLIISTYWGQYVLDHVELEGNYWERRLTLAAAGKSLPHKLYPLKHRITLLSQLVNSKAKKFINKDGKIIKYRKTKFHSIVLKRVTNSVQIFNGKWQNYVVGVPFPFITDERVEYLSLIKHKHSYLIFDTHFEKPEQVRTRVKL